MRVAENREQRAEVYSFPAEIIKLTILWLGVVVPQIY
jgi:hypothetical protein